ncbi:hypothetical protein FRB91_009700 [Serendipita sp. 411]|nr:hypothetical protein FRB91_009700 [Serendipita sp. 411]
MPHSRSRSPRREHEAQTSRRERRRDGSYDSRDRRRHDGQREERHERKRKRSLDREDDRGRRHNTHSRSRSRERHKESRRDRSKERKDRKEEKKRQKEEERIRQLAELSVYNPVDNPFHDANLNQQFKWHKKAEKDKKTGVSAAEAQARDIARRQEAKEELERLNKRRAEREAEMALREEEEARMARLQESAQMAEWIAKEGDFQLEQEQRRSIIRLKERRAKAIDFLSLNLRYVNPVNEGDEDEDGLDAAGLDIDLDEPYHILDNLNLAQTEELHDDIERYLRLEESDIHIDFWTNMIVICKARLDDLRQQGGDGRRGPAMSRQVESNISTLLENKTYDQLAELQRSVQAKLSSGDPVDVDYWENLLKSLLVWKSKAKLKVLHEVVVRNRLEQLRKRQRDEALQARAELLGGDTPTSRNHWPAEVRALPSQQPDEDSMEVDQAEPYSRDMSVPLFEDGKLSYEDRQLTVINPVNDLRELFAQRRIVAATRFVPKAMGAAPVEEQVAEAPAVMDAFTRELNLRMDAEADLEEDDEEELYNVEATLSNPTTYTWEDKYRPRKPRYLNRVHTGYEWNKYNQTHYDTDNPPPKVVQGYKFNIFYPDLIDKSKTPTYKIIKEPGTDDTVLLLFTAGPPYEDIAFRIVNRDWEHSHKRGFKSTFDRGCLSLWFNFRRNSNLEELVLSGAFGNEAARSTSPARSHDSGSSSKWPEEDFEDSDLSKPAENNHPGPLRESIGMGPGRTGVKGVIRDRAEAAALERSKKSIEIAALNRRLESTSLAAGGTTWQEDDNARRMKEGLEPVSVDKGDSSTGDIGKYGYLREVGAANYVEAVEDRDARVLVHIYDSSLERCHDLDQKLTRLARNAPNTKFLRVRATAIGFALKKSTDTGALGSSHFQSSKIRGDQHNYILSEDSDFLDDDELELYEEEEVDVDMLPTMLVYERGELLHTWVRVDWEAGKDEIENLLFKHNLIPRRSQPGAQGLAALSDDESSDTD